MGKRTDGIRSIADLMARCRLDDVTGCWVWAGGCNNDGEPITAIPAGVLQPTELRSNARRAGWLLAGKKLEPGQIVMRLATCSNRLCVNPQHAKAGTRQEASREAAKRGSYSDPERLARLSRASLKQAISPDSVRAAEKALNDGATVRDVSERVGIGPTTVRRIRAGTHIHQTQALLPGASVFAWRP